jgi:hypothetical protein
MARALVVVAERTMGCSPPARVARLRLASAGSIDERPVVYQRQRPRVMNAITLRNREYGPTIMMDPAPPAIEAGKGSKNN